MIRFATHYFLLFTLMATTYPYFQLLLRARGFSAAEVGCLLGLMPFGRVRADGLGVSRDRLGKRRSFLIGCLIATAALLLPFGRAAEFWLVAVLSALLGLVWRSAIPLTDALASHELSDPAHQYGRVRVWGSAGFVLTLLVVRILRLIDESSVGSMLTYMLAAAGFCAVEAAFLPDSHRAADHRQRRPAGEGGFDRAFWLFLAAAGTQQIGMTAYYSFFSQFLKDSLRMENAAWVWAIGSAAEMPLLFFGGRVIRRLGLAAMLMTSMAAVTVRLAVYAAAPVLWAVLPAQLFHAATFGMFHAASIEFLRRKTPPHRRGTAMALYMSLAIGLPSWLASTLGGVIIERWGYAAMFLSYAVPPLAGIVLLAVGWRGINVPAQGTKAR